ncbi:MAG TPA: SIS domain-containing protein [Terriglobales bacterium]|nr:SIS domain-containing protein [Terriglobales bacterium]
MTRFLEDILRQPDELERTLGYLGGAGWHRLEEAAGRLRRASHVYLTGIGSSWHAALCAAPLFAAGARPVYLQDAAELLHFAAWPRDAVIVAISRTGKSLEIVRLLAKARESGATVIAVTNAENGTLAREAQIPILVPVTFDHAISVNTYSTLVLAAGLLAWTALRSFDDALISTLSGVIGAAAQSIAGWQEQIARSSWLTPGASYYFLARGSSLGSCHEARLLWEEGAKSPATAMGTGGFRHGPQEMVAAGLRFGIWIDGRRLREEDLAVARDLRKLGAGVMLIGQNLPEDAGDLVLQLPEMSAEWQFVIDAIPAQLAAERLAQLAGADCDSFRLCSYIVEHDGGLFDENVVAPDDHGNGFQGREARRGAKTTPRDQMSLAEAAVKKRNQ